MRKQPNFYLSEPYEMDSLCVPLLVGNVCVMSSCNEETRYTALQTSIPVQGVSLPASVAVALGGR